MEGGAPPRRPFSPCRRAPSEGSSPVVSLSFLPSPTSDLRPPRPNNAIPVIRDSRITLSTRLNAGAPGPPFFFYFDRIWVALTAASAPTNSQPRKRSGTVHRQALNSPMPSDC